MSESSDSESDSVLLADDGMAAEDSASTHTPDGDPDSGSYLSDSESLDAQDQIPGLGAVVDDTDASEEQFDITLPATHSYMSKELVCMGGRSVLEPGWEGRVPCVSHHSVVYPGETLPMMLKDRQDMQLFTDIIKGNKLFGLLCPDETGELASGYGVLCEVYEAVLEEHIEDGSFKIKARAQQRFRLVKISRVPIYLNLFMRVKPMWIRILPEVRLGDALFPVRHPSLDHLRTTSQRRSMDVKIRTMDAVMTQWPLFVYEILDFHRISKAIKDYYKTLNIESLPSDLVSLSFWVASNLTLAPRDRLALFTTDDALHRLYMGLEHINKKCVLCCSTCAAKITRREHIFAMSSEGMHSNYCNVAGYVHDTVTVTHAENVSLRGRPSEEFTWFPGYTWTIIMCRVCLVHIGWQFNAKKKTLRPRRFWGLCRNNLTPQSELTTQNPSEGDSA